MEQRLVKFLGSAAKHTFVALRRALAAVFITGILVFLITAVATEVVGFILSNGQFNGTTHLVAAALAISFAYAVAITVFLGEILRAIIKITEMIVEESEKAVQAAVREAGVLAREAGGEAAHLGRAALGDAGAVGKGLEHVVGGVAGAVGGVASGAVHEVEHVEHGVANHMPGHHNSAGSTPTVPTQTSNS